MSSAEGTYKLAPKKRGVKTGAVSVTTVTMLTIALDRVMSNATKHGKAIRFPKPESFRHPRKIIGKTKMATTNTFWNALTPAGKTEGWGTVGPHYNGGRMTLQLSFVAKEIRVKVAS
jgi:hypothetical protein